MRIHPLAAGAMLGALAAMSVSVPDSASAAIHLEAKAAADPNTIASFNVYLPLTQTEALEKLLHDQTDPSSSRYHQWLTPAQFKQQFGPSRADVAKVSAALEAAGFVVTAEKTQNLQVQGSVAAVQKMFGTHLTTVKMPNGRMQLSSAEHHLALPPALLEAGAVVPEFVTHLQSHVHSKVLSKDLRAPGPAVRLSSAMFYYPNDLNEAYQLPSFRTEAVPLNAQRPAQIAGVGAHIGIVISSVILQSDLAKTFNSSFKFGTPTGTATERQAYSANSNLPVPTVRFRNVGAGSPAFDPNTADGAEASLDTQMSLGTAPGAQETVYDMEQLTTDNIAAAYTDVDEDNIVDVVSSSFGECELDFTPAYNDGVDFTGILRVLHALFQQGNAQGITFVTSSGDSGARSCLSEAFVKAANHGKALSGTNFVVGVENPADDPNVTTVGGTNLTTSAAPTGNDANYAAENADFDARLPAQFDINGKLVAVGDNTWGSGGGFSVIFNKPFYQNIVKTGSNRQRAIPDVSLMMGGCPGDADLAKDNCLLLPRSAIIVWIGGQPAGLVGTSSSAPEFAGVLALAVELNGGRLGNVNPLIYGLSALQTITGGVKAPAALQFFHRNISGSNNFYRVHPGDAFSEVLGNSTLEVKKFLGLQFAAPAGTPNTPSNP